MLILFNLCEIHLVGRVFCFVFGGHEVMLETSLLSTETSHVAFFYFLIFILQS